MRRERIFFIFETGTRGVVFIKMLDELRPHIDVNKIGVAIVKHIAETKESQSRFACRLIPIDILCKAKIDDFNTFAGPILAKYFTTKKEEDAKGEESKDSPASPVSWCMEMKNNNNNNIKKNKILDFIYKTIDGDRNPVSLKESDYSIIVEVYRDLMMIGVVPLYKELKKYNLQQLIKEGKDANESGEDEVQPRRVIKISDLIGKKR